MTVRAVKQLLSGCRHSPALSCTKRAGGRKCRWDSDEDENFSNDFQHAKICVVHIPRLDLGKVYEVLFPEEWSLRALESNVYGHLRPLAGWYLSCWHMANKYLHCCFTCQMYPLSLFLSLSTLCPFFLSFSGPVHSIVWDAGETGKKEEESTALGSSFVPFSR